MDRPTDGVICGPATRMPDVPDVNGMLSAADVPLGDGGALPHSLEWYAGAKDRQAARDIEKDELDLLKSDLRNEWADLAIDGMELWITKVTDLANVQEPQDINSLLARTQAERPTDEGELEKLKAIVDNAEAQRFKLRELNADIVERLRHVEHEIRTKKVEDQEREDVEREAARIAKAHKEKCEEALRKAQAMMYGDVEEDVEPEPNDDDDDEAVPSPAADGRPGTGGPLPPVPPQAGQSPPATREGTPGSRTPSRSSKKGELPPLASPPPAPKI